MERRTFLGLILASLVPAIPIETKPLAVIESVKPKPEPKLDKGGLGPFCRDVCNRLNQTCIEEMQREEDEKIFGIAA